MQDLSPDLIALAEFAPPAILAERLAGLHAADVVEILNTLDPHDAGQVLTAMPAEQAIYALDEAGLERIAVIFGSLSDEVAKRLICGMSADRRAHVFRMAAPLARKRLAQSLEPDMRKSIEDLLSWPDDTAGAIMTTEFVSMGADWTVERGLAHVHNVGRSAETIYAIYLINPADDTLVGAMSLRQLVIAERGQLLSEVSTVRKPITVTPRMPRADVARLISKYDLLAVPVVDEKRRVIGIVTVDDVIDAILEEGTEDVQKLGGMEALGAPYMQIGFGSMIRKRAGWLCALFLSEMLTASAMQHFETELEKAVVLTLFIPLIMSSGGNSGSQATSLIIRALALGELRLRDWWRVALREVPSGITLGAILGVIGVARISLWQHFGFYDYGDHWLLIAMTVGAALVGIVTFGSLSGSMLPFLLQRIGFDPASASAPFVATLVDVTGLVIYFTVALAILGGTLL